MTFRKLCTALALGLGLGASVANAADIEVEVTNMTHGIYFTPLLVISHDGDSHLFQVGMAASTALQAMAEGGAIDDLVAAQDAAGAVSASDAAGIPASPGGNGETGVTATEATTVVHIHRGNHGDTDPAGGVSDVDSRVHRWLNPVARVVITVN